jgi:hypothetical protein
MTGDFSRTSQDWTKSYTGVLMQQGRVQVDADWNEQLALALHRTHTETRDVIGRCGTPKDEDGFKISATPRGDDFFIHPGRYYVDGLLCEIDPEWVELTVKATKAGNAFTYTTTLASSWLDGRPIAAGDWVEFKIDNVAGAKFAEVVSIDDQGTLVLDVVFPVSWLHGRLRRAITYLTQPFYPSPDLTPGVSSPANSPVAGTGLTLEEGYYLVYLEAWERAVNALEDPHIREVALNGPDTAERIQTVWQVRVLKVTADAQTNLCKAAFPEWKSLIDGVTTTGQMNARSSPPKSKTDPCMLPPLAGFQGLQNQLYRIEIFQPGDRASATFVWSRDNGMVETGIVSVDTSDYSVVTVNSLGVDGLHSFAINDWVEIVDRNDELSGTPRFLAQIVAPAPDPVKLQITLSAPVPDVYRDGINSPTPNNYRLKRWDMSGSGGSIPIVSGWMDIESGVQVSFTEGHYAPRVWWLIPARTATADIEWPPFQAPDTEPIPQPPFGTARHFCRIGSVHSVYGNWDFGDCRTEFPPLTHICADDVCYHADCDALKDAKTVEQALDELCDLSNLRFHKKMLHGWGVVCGLQVECGGDVAGALVNVRDGYAIDCEGNDILFKAAPFNVISHIQTPSGIADGDYSLILDPTVAGQLRIAQYPAQKGTVLAALHGTLLERFYAEYIKPLIDFAENPPVQLPPGSQVTAAQELISSLTNLLAPLNNSTTGGRVYISREEASVLQQTFEGFRNLIRDKTFCGFLSGWEWPEYPVPISGIDSIFGMGGKTRVRVDAAETHAATVGGDNTIHIYTLQSPAVLAQVLTLPSTFPGAIVQDAIFSSDGKTLFAIATLAGNSVVASIVFGNANATWLTATVNGATFSSLAAVGTSIYTAGLGQGLYQITSDGATISAILRAQFNAIGPLAADRQTTVVYAAANSASVTTAFNEVIGLDTAKQYFMTPYVLPNALTGSPQDDIAVVSAPGVNAAVQQKIYVTTNPPAGGATKQVAINSPAAATGVGSWLTADLAENTPVHFAYNFIHRTMYVAYAGSNHIDALVEAAAVTIQQYEYPAEVSPISAAWNLHGNNIYLQNSVSNTISVIPFSAKPWDASQFNVLAKYRIDAVRAMLQLLEGTLQYLKDGFCDLFLVNCPSCDEDEILYLAAIRVQNQRVYKVCNFSLRKYVHSFPTVEYWLSAILVIPIVRWLFGQFCCLDLSNAFANVKAPQFSVPQVAGMLQQFQPSAISTAFSAKLATTGSFVTDYLTSAIAPPGAAPAPHVNVSNAAGQNSALVQQQLSAAGLTVNVESYDPSQVAANAYRAAVAPSQIAPGSSVTLVADSTGTVRYVVPAPDQVQIVQNQLTAAQQAQAQSQLQLQNQVSTLNTQIANLQAAHKVQIDALTQQLTQLSGSLDAVKLTLQKISPPPPKS